MKLEELFENYGQLRHQGHLDGEAGKDEAKHHPTEHEHAAYMKGYKAGRKKYEKAQADKKPKERFTKKKTA